jgi:hypothetical protein
VIVDSLQTTGSEFRRLTGWEIRPEGACRGDRCVPLAAPVRDVDGPFDVAELAERLAMPIAHDATHGLWAIGPECGGRVLDSARLPDIVLPDFDGRAFDVATTRGTKVLLLAWASW